VSAILAVGAALRSFAAPPLPATAQGTLSERSFDCMIAANEIVEVGSAVAGVIQTFYVERGDYIEAGQLIAMLESSAERAALRVAQARAERQIDLEVSRANRALRRKQSQRAQALFAKDTLSLNQREQAETEASVAELEYQRAAEDQRLAALQLEQARVALNRRMIVSPISGLVVERMMSRGEVVIDNDSIARIAQIDPLRIEVILPSHLFGQIKPGDPAEISPEAPYDRPHSASVAIVDSILDGASGTFGVRLLIPNTDRSLPGGLRCQARFPTPSR
jgi:RND family efflux transporter MFP subunit